MAARKPWLAPGVAQHLLMTCSSRCMILQADPHLWHTPCWGGGHGAGEPLTALETPDIGNTGGSPAHPREGRWSGISTAPQTTHLITLVQVPTVSESMSCLQNGLTWQVLRGRLGRQPQRTQGPSVWADLFGDLCLGVLECSWQARRPELVSGQGWGRGCSWRLARPAPCPAVPIPHTCPLWLLGPAPPALPGQVEPGVQHLCGVGDPGGTPAQGPKERA